MKEITYTYQRTKEDFYKHLLWHRMLKTIPSKIMNFVFPIMAVGLFILSLGLELEMYERLAILYFIAFPFINFLFIRGRVNSMFRNPEFEFDTTTFTYTDKGIKISSKHGENTLEYEYIKNVYVVKNYIYIYIDRVNAFLINKEAIGSENVDAITDALLDYTKPYTVKFRKY